MWPIEMSSAVLEDEIVIRGLEVWCSIGVPDEELASPQRLLVDVSIAPRTSFEATGDDLSATVDYAAVCTRLAVVASERPRRLVETLAADFAGTVLKEFGAIRVAVEVRKFILEETEFVGVRCVRKAPENF